MCSIFHRNCFLWLFLIDSSSNSSDRCLVKQSVCLCVRLSSCWLFSRRCCLQNKYCYCFCWLERSCSSLWLGYSSVIAIPILCMCASHSMPMPVHAGIEDDDTVTIISYGWYFGVDNWVWAEKRSSQSLKAVHCYWTDWPSVITYRVEEIRFRYQSILLTISRHIH